MSVVAITPLEVLGALSAKLTHDLNNQMTIITGSAQFAQAVIDDPKRVTDAMRSITIASEKMSRLVSVLGDYRRESGLQLGSASIEELAEELRERLLHRPGWHLEPTVDFSGRAALSRHWFAFGVDRLLDTWQAESGSFRLSKTMATEIPQRMRRALRPDESQGFLNIRLESQDSNPPDIEGIRAQFRSPEFVAVLEVLKSVGGWISSESRPEGGSTVSVLLPMTE